MEKLKRMYRFMGPYKKYYLLALVFILLSQALLSLTPLVIQTSIDSLISDRPISNSKMEFLINKLGGVDYLRENLWLVGGLLLAMTILRGVFLFLKNLNGHKAAENHVRILRNSLYDHIQRLPYEYHIQAETGELLQRATSDIETIRRFLAVQALEFMASIFIIGLVLKNIFSLNRRLALVSIIILPLTFVFALIFFNKIKKTFKEIEKAEGKMTTALQENITGVRVVKAFARSGYEIEKFDSLNSNYSQLSYDLMNQLARYWGVSDLLSLGQICLVIVAGVRLAYRGQISIGVYAAFISYVNFLVWPVRQMGRNLTEMGKAFVALDRIDSIFEIPIEDLRENKREDPIEGGIEFKDVSFSYTGKEDVLKDISFSLKPGESLALLGPTGSGKSSLVHLIPRLYDYNKGSIKIDSRELKDIDRHWIRENVGLVLQEPFLYAKTIGDNIRFQDPDLSDCQVREAAKVASIHQDIMGFTDHYETLVGERGTSLSGGQQQRIAIARNIIKDKPIVIFDDSLSALDTETDLAIRKALAERKHRATSIIISHRVSTALEADKIILLDQGRIVEMGDHKSLMEKNGAYRQLYDRQNKLN